MVTEGDPPSLHAEVEQLVAKVKKTGRLGHGFEARAALALSVARTIEGAEDKYIAALTRELRGLIAELADGIPREGDVTPFGSDLPAVPAKVRDTKKPEAGDPGRGRGKGGRAARNAADAVATPRGRRAARDRPADG